MEMTIVCKLNSSSCNLTNSVAYEVFGSYLLDSRPAVEFRYEAAKDKLANLNLDIDEGADMVFITPSDDPTGAAYREGSVIGRQGQLMKLAGCIDLDSELSVAITSHLDSQAYLEIGRLRWCCPMLPLEKTQCGIPSE